MNRKERRRLGKEPSRAPLDRSAVLHDLLARSNAEFAAGRLPQAAALLVKVIRLDPMAAEVFSNLAVVLEQLGQPQEALAACRRAVALEPPQAAAYYNMGISLSTLGRQKEAVIAYRRAIALDPNDAEAFSNLAAALSDIGDLDGAIEASRRAIALDGRIATAHANLGSALRRKGQTAEAIEACRMAINLAPDMAKAYAELGAALIDKNSLKEAIAACGKAIEADAGLLEGYLYLGATFAKMRKPDNARRCCEYVLVHKPDYLEAVYNRAIAFQELGQPEDAVTGFLRTLALDGTHLEAHNNLQYVLHYSQGSSLAEIYHYARMFSEQVELGEIRTVFPNPADPARKLKVGYVSGDFGKHPIGYFLSPVLANHNHGEFETFCYYNGTRRDEITDRFQAMSGYWRNIWKRPDKEVAETIATDGIDILVDLSGHTGLNRLPLFALKPAPIQVSWLGYWGTTGLSAMDYLLTDALMAPPEEERCYSERIVRLPGIRFCYSPPDDAPAPKGEPPALRNGWVTFGSFNNLAKLGPGVIGLWAGILQAVPNARLMLKWGSLADGAVRRRLIEAFDREGIASDRLILRGRSLHAEMLAEYGDVDIALDPFPFSGGLTSCEALWMGVPVVTLPGDRAISRQTAGFLTVLELSDLAAATPAEYVAIAQNLAADIGRLKELRIGLRSRMAQSALCDGATYTRNVETAFRTMWEKWCTDQGHER